MIDNRLFLLLVVLGVQFQLDALEREDNRAMHHPHAVVSPRSGAPDSRTRDCESSVRNADRPTD